MKMETLTRDFQYIKVTIVWREDSNFYNFLILAKIKSGHQNGLYPPPGNTRTLQQKQVGLEVKSLFEVRTGICFQPDGKILFRTGQQPQAGAAENVPI